MAKFKIGQIVHALCNQGDLVIGNPYEIIKLSIWKDEPFYWIKGEDTNNVLTLVPEKANLIGK